MNRRIALASLAALALVVLLVRLRPEAPAVEIAPKRVVLTELGPLPDPVPLIDADAVTARAVAERNLFAYRELARPRPPVIQVASLRPIVIAAPAVEVPRPEPRIEAPPLPTFPHDYLGRFGPASDPIAVFRIDGDVVNGRVGEVLGGSYVVRKIGADDVEIGFTTSSHVVRVGM